MTITKEKHNVKTNDSSAGATPVAGGAMPSQSYPTGSVFAAYRLPYPGAIGAREAGVCFEGEPAGGATPPADGAPPTPPAGAAPAEPPTPPATGDGALGDAGKRALEAERTARKSAEDRAKAAETERDELKAATQSDTEKAIADARKAGADETSTKLHGQIRYAKVEAALSAAGIKPSVMDLAVKADEFATLKVNDKGEVAIVEGLDEAIKEFKTKRGDLFGAASGDGSADGGARGNQPSPTATLEDAVNAQYAGKP